MIRLRTLSLLIGLAALLRAPIASAELAPTPVENGDIYFSAGIALYNYHTQDFQVGRLYADDDFFGNGISTNNPRGFLLSYGTDQKHVVTPEINFGYAFEEPLFKGALGSKTRLHFSAYGNRREGSGFKALQMPVANSTVVTNPATGIPEVRDVNVLIAPINGQPLPNGNDASIFVDQPFDNNSMVFRSYFGSGDMMIFFDEPDGMWQFSRGAGLTVGYENSSFAWGLNSSAFGAERPALQPASWTYSFRMHTVYVGPRASFSVGFEPVRQLSVFMAGSFAPMLAFSSTQGTQVGSCLSRCLLNGPSSTGSVGTVNLDATDLNFAYDARLEAGASIYLNIIRLTATVGAFVNNQFAMPQESDNGGRVETTLAGQWGYYGRAMATFAFY